MRTILRSSSLLIPLLLIWALPALAQEATGNEALVITAENRTAAAEAARGEPRAEEGIRAGDQIRYTLTFTNPTEGPVSNVVLHNPLPSGLAFIASSANASRADARVEYSIDGGETFSAEPIIEVIEGGQSIRRPATPDEYTDIRWVVEGAIQPGAQVSATFEMEMPSDGPAGPAAPQR